MTAPSLPPTGPRWAAAVLRLVFGRRDGRLLQAELDQEYRDFIAPTRSGVGARAWYLRQVVGSIGWKLIRTVSRLSSPSRAMPMDALVGDLRFAVRTLRAAPSFSLMAIGTMALGIGLSATVFSVLNGVVLAPLPYPEPERLVRLWGGNTVSKAVAQRVVENARSFAPLAGSVEANRTLTGIDEPREMSGLEVTPSYLSMLGVVPLMGRTFVDEETRPGAGTSVILGHDTWQRIFGGDPAILGQRIQLGGSPVTVVGVMPAGHRPVARGTEFWAPMEIDPDDYSDFQGVAQVGLIGRLADGVSLDAATAEVASVANVIHQESPDAYSESWVTRSAPRPLHDWIVADAGGALWAAMGASIFVLLIGCANVATLLLARSTARQREIAIRIGLGARAGRVARQLLTESLVLGLAGGAAGMALAYALVDALVAAWPAGIPMAGDIKVEPVVLGFAFVTAVVSSLIFGSAPAWRAARLDPQTRLKEGGLTATGGQAATLNRWFVAVEVALAVILVIGAGLMLRSLGALIAVDPGFEVDRVTTFRVRLPDSGAYQSHAERNVYYEQLGARVRAMPGVEGYGAVTFLPMATGVPSAVYRVVDREYADNEVPPSAAFQLVAGEYFRTLGIPLERGRLFEATDLEDSPIVGVVNRALARDAFGDADPLGRRLNMFGGVDFTVVGVVGDSRQRSPGQASQPEAFFSFGQISWWPSMFITVRTTGTRAPTAAELREAVWSVDPDIPVSQVRSMRDVVARASSQPRFFTVLLAAIGALAMLLGGIGVYGVTSYTIGQQVHEFGIRLALGAPRRTIVRGALSRSLRPVLAGTAGGVLGALALTGLLRGMLFGVAARDPLTFAAVALGLVAVGSIASYLPARRAAAIAPTEALRAR